MSEGQQPDQPAGLPTGLGVIAHEDLVQQQKQELEAQTRQVFEKVSDFLKGELEVNTNEYDLLSTLNQAAAEKYGEMADYANGLVRSASSLHAKYEELRPHLEQIDELEAQIANLEHVVYRLDDFTKRLEDKVRQL